MFFYQWRNIRVIKTPVDEKFLIKMIPFLYFILKYILFTYSRKIFQFLDPKMESVAHKPFW